MKISFILLGEGSSDLRLVEHIESLLVSGGFDEVSGEAPDLGRFYRTVGRSVEEKLRAILQHHPNVDVIFVHRDADNVGIDVRVQEIVDSASRLLCVDRVIPVVPVRMLETWLLADEEAIKRVAGNSSYPGKISCIPNVRSLENLAAAKQVLLDALCEASQVQGGRLAKFKKCFSEMRARLTFDLDPEGPVGQLSSYQNFRQQIDVFCQDRLNKGGGSDR